MNANKIIPQQTLSWLTLFASMGTMLCCAVPIILVSLGLGAVVASLTSSFPFLVTLASYESWMFAVSGLLLLFTAGVLWGREQHCPGDPVLARHCAVARRWNRRLFWLASGLWLIGFSAAFLLLPLRNLLGV